MTLQVPSGDPWKLEGSILEKDYSVTAAATSLIGLRQADASCGHGATQDAATRADLELFRVMSGRSHGMTA